MVLDGSSKKSVEFVEESLFNTTPTDPTMLNFGGYAAPVTVKKSPVTKKIPYLKGCGDTNRLQATESEKVGEAFEVTIELELIDWSILPYVLAAANASTYAIGDTVHYISLATCVGDEFEVLSGGIFSNCQVSIENEDTAQATLTAMFAETTGILASDFIGSGSHAASPSGAVMKYGDITNTLYDAALPSVEEFFIESTAFGIEYNNIKAVYDQNAGNNSGIAGWSLGQRNISLELQATLGDLSMSTEYLGGEKHTYGFTLGGKAFSFSNILWEGDFNEVLDPDDVIAMPLTASNVDLDIS
jgi:hypothetical protein